MRFMKVFLAGLSALILSLNVAAQAQTEEGPRRLTVEEQEDRQERLKDRLESKDCFGHVHGKDLDPLKKKNLAWVRSGDKSVRPKCESLIINYAKVSRRLHERGEETPPDKKFAKIVMQIEVQEGVIEHLEALLAGEDKDSIMHRVYTIQSG